MIPLVQRPTKVSIRAQNVKGGKLSLVLDGWQARLFQHEFDHLEVSILLHSLSQWAAVETNTVYMHVGSAAHEGGDFALQGKVIFRKVSQVDVRQSVLDFLQSPQGCCSLTNLASVCYLSSKT